MNDNIRKRNSHVEIDDLIDDAVNHALVRRSEALLPLSDEEANSIAGGTATFPTVHGVIINPNPTPCPPIVHGVILNPPIVHGVVINPNPPCPPAKPPIIINGIVIKPNLPLADS